VRRALRERYVVRIRAAEPITEPTLVAAVRAAGLQLPESWLPFVAAR
jgi:hypothetical protein